LSVAAAERQFEVGRRGAMTNDPVCGMEVEEATAAAEVDYQGNRYFFCSESCQEEFLRHPDGYAIGGDQPGASP
jgi:Cu+-exporting ATPase